MSSTVQTMRALIAAAVLSALPCALYGQTQTMQGETSPAFQQGLTDRNAWESWIASISGDYRAGAEYWAAQRSTPTAGACFDTAGNSRGDWTVGCLSAKARLTPSDERRKTEPEYRRGWNSFTALASPTTATPVAPGTPAAVGSSNTAVVIARGFSVVPGAIVCPSYDIVDMMVNLYVAHWTDIQQDRLTHGQSRLLRGESTPEPTPELYGCALIPPGTQMILERGNIVPLVSVTLADGRVVRGVTSPAMIAKQ
jgi:hypothetical protein